MRGVETAHLIVCFAYLLTAGLADDPAGLELAKPLAYDALNNCSAHRAVLWRP